jgi:hypothetical protein
MTTNSISYSDQELGAEVNEATEKAQRLEERTRELAWSRKYSQFGICWNCTRFWFTKTKYGKETAICARYDKPDLQLSSSDPVIECSEHVDRFTLSVNAMWSMATLIEVEEPRRAGFIAEEKK